MSIASIEARASALMSLHKEELTRALAHFEHLAGYLFDEVEEKVKALFEPEQSGSETLVPCAGTNCGTTTGAHSAECVAEHAAAVAGPVVDHEPASDEQQRPEASTDEPQANEPASDAPSDAANPEQSAEGAAQ